METISDFIEQIRQRYVPDSTQEISDRKVAGLLLISRQAYSKLKTGKTKHVSEPVAYQIAVLLGLNPAYVMLCLAIERAKHDRIRRVWEDIARNVPRVAAVILAAVITYSSLFYSAKTLASDFAAESVYYVKRCFRRWLSQLSLSRYRQCVS